MIELSVCIGSACHLKGSYNVIQIFQQMIEENNLHDQIEFKTAFCKQSCCREGVSVSVNDTVYDVMPENAREFFVNRVMALKDS